MNAETLSLLLFVVFMGWMLTVKTRKTDVGKTKEEIEAEFKAELEAKRH